MLPEGPSRARQDPPRPVVVIAGFSHAGKTTLICQLIPLLKARGLKVAVLKHSHRADPDHGKDTWRFRQAGAEVVALAAPGLLQVTFPSQNEPRLEEALARLMPEADVILVEGYKSAHLPKIAVLGPEAEGELPDYPQLIAVVSDAAVAAKVPVFRPHEAEALARWLYAYFRL